MALTAITIENFKGIGAPVTIPLAPITLLFGKNSAGKSTVLHALHYAREVLANGNPDPDTTEIGGESVDLGGFRRLVHGRQQHYWSDLGAQYETVRIRLEFDVDDDGIPPVLVDWPRDDGTSEPERVQLLNEIDLPISSSWVEFKCSCGENGKPYIGEYGVGINGEEFARIAGYGPSTARLQRVRFEEHPVFTSLKDYEGGESLDEVYPALGEEEQEGQRRPLPTRKVLPLLDAVVPERNAPFSPPDPPVSPLRRRAARNRAAHLARASSLEEEHDEDYLLFWRLLAHALVGPLGLLLEELEAMRYLGPIRYTPSRGYRPALTHQESRWSDGRAAWDALANAETQPDGSTPLIDETDKIMRSGLNLGYGVKREMRIPLDADGPIMAELALLERMYEEKDASYFTQRVWGPLNSLPKEPSVQLYDVRQKMPVDPPDIGVGVAQVLPVVVGAIAPSTKTSPCRLFAVEQPELHIHPAVQCALGDVFIDAAQDLGRMFLLETHSEHLVLRLLRRVREDNEGDPVGPEMLSVVYVKVGKTGIEMTHLPVTEDGDFEDPWPDGFFDERDSELF